MATYNKIIDENRLTQLWAIIKGKFVAQETGKGLSSNDYTTDEKTKLSGIATGAQVNVLEGIQKNGETVTITNKIANISVPVVTYEPNKYTTNDTYLKVGDSEMDLANYAFAAAADGKATSALTAVAGKQDALTAGANITITNNVISASTGVKFEVVDALPETGSENVIYLVPNSGTAPNIYDEYIWISSNSSFEKIGTTAIDLSNYVQFDDITVMTEAELAAICV